ncbi:MAG: hypothetical protein JNK79_02635 [Chitinophagaceae bacterium]|nr:hypothetical protein [Chitinophagaceae bacterium]
MERQTHRTQTAFLTILILLTVISIKMAFIHSSELLALLLITIPGILVVIYLSNRSDEIDESP